jgi:hypothetical protein
LKFKYLWIFSKISNVIGKDCFGKCSNTRLKPLSVSFNSKEENLLISIPCNKNKIQFDNTKQLCRKDIIIQKSYLLVRFKWTKTIQFGDRVLYIPLVAIPSPKLCPVSAYKRMCEFNPASTESPAFLIESRGKLIPLAYNQFQNKLKQLISLIGLKPLLFSSHSFVPTCMIIISKCNLIMPLLIKYITSIIPTPGNACKVHFFKYICLPIESVIKVAIFVSEITRNYVLTFLTNNIFLNFISNF